MTKDDELRIGDLVCKPGQKVRGFLTVDGPGYQVNMPLSIIRGVADGPVVGVTGGVHGAEYPGIEAAIQLGRQLDPKDIRGAVIITSIVNVPAFFGRATYINPMDGLNLNRTYPGRSTGTISERMVWEHQKKVIEACDYYIDLHGGDMVEAILPFVLYFKSGRAEQDDMARRMANVYGLGRVLQGTVPGSGYAAAALAGKPAIIAEAGGQGLVGQTDVDYHLNGVKNVLGMLGVLSGGTAPKDVKLLPDLKMIWHSSNRQGIVKLNVGIGDTVKKGQVVGRLTDLWGEDLEEVVSQASGQILFIVSCLPINQGDALFAVLTEDNDRSQ